MRRPSPWLAGLELMPCRIGGWIRAMKFVTLILALLIPQIALARIGETLEQCERRYGKPIKVVEEMRFYEKSGVKIIMMMWRGKVHYIHYADDGRWASSTHFLTKAFTWELLKKNFPERTGKEIKALYDKGDYKWKAQIEKAGYRVLNLTAKGWIASGGYLSISTYEFRNSGDFLKRQQMKTKADAKILIEGF